MAIITKYFSTAAEIAANAPGSDGSGDNWANRAVLFDSVWSSVITSHDFNTSSLVCLIGAGTYVTSTQALNTSIFTTAPSTMARPLVFRAYTGSDLWIPPNSDWVSAEPCWDDSGMPVLDGGNTGLVYNLGSWICYGIKFLGSKNNETIENCGVLDWCIVEATAYGTSAGACAGVIVVQNSVLRITTHVSLAYAHLISASSILLNVRCEGLSTATSGNRYGVYRASATNFVFDRVCIINCPGNAIVPVSTSTSQSYRITRCVINSCGLGVIGNDTVGQAAVCTLDSLYISNCAGWGVDASNSLFLVTNCRLRNNTVGNITNTGDILTDLDNYTVAGSDAEFVNAAAGDYRIAASSSLWGKGYGAGDEIPSPAVIAAAVWGRAGRSTS